MHFLHQELKTCLAEQNLTLKIYLHSLWTEGLPHFLPGWTQLLWKYWKSKQNPLKSLYPTLQIHLLSIVLQFYPMSFGLFAVHLHWEFTIIVTHPSAQLSFSKQFTFSTISSCHVFPMQLFSRPYYILVRKPLPSPLQISMYCGNTKQMHTPLQRKYPFLDREAVI